MKVVKTSLSSFVTNNQRDWDLYIGTLRMSINGTVNTVTGYSPYFLMTGREMSSPTLERIQHARDTLDMDTYTSQLCEAMWYIWEGVSEGITKKASGLSAALGIMAEQFRSYDSGDYVFIRKVPRRFYTDEKEALRYNITAKLQKCRYTGAHKVIHKVSPSTYVVDVRNTPITIHVRHMKPAGRFSVVQKQRMRAQEKRRGERKKFGVERDELDAAEELVEQEESHAGDD
ncbi:hypothetical protein B484DRAFT_473806 [Ochromonadaceae sp. CCMP2298]|nr:hypothetical protein B484DRAFT_473806 [Ochromonadaceae sp. CCMP2298]